MRTKSSRTRTDVLTFSIEQQQFVLTHIHDTSNGVMNAVLFLLTPDDYRERVSTHILVSLSGDVFDAPDFEALQKAAHEYLEDYVTMV